MPESFSLPPRGRHQGYQVDAQAETFAVLTTAGEVELLLQGQLAARAAALMDELWDAWVDQQGDLAHQDDREFRDQVDAALSDLVMAHDALMPLPGVA